MTTPELLRTLAEESNAQPLVLPAPPPSMVFSGFGPGSLCFDLRLIIRCDDYAKVLEPSSGTAWSRLGSRSIISILSGNVWQRIPMSLC